VIPVCVLVKTDTGGRAGATKVWTDAPMSAKALKIRLLHRDVMVLTW